MGSFWIDLSNLFLYIGTCTHRHIGKTPWFLLFLLCSYQIRHISVFFLFLFIYFIRFFLLCTSLSFLFLYFIAPNKVIPRMCMYVFLVSHIYIKQNVFLRKKWPESILNRIIHTRWKRLIFMIWLWLVCAINFFWGNAVDVPTKMYQQR